jgi:hypothetical protein
MDDQTNSVTVGPGETERAPGSGAVALGRGGRMSCRASLYNGHATLGNDSSGRNEETAQAIHQLGVILGAARGHGENTNELPAD